MKNRIIMNIQGCCPFCGGRNLDYSKEFFHNDTAVFPYKCEDCGATAREVYYLDFIHHENCEKDGEFIENSNMEDD